MTGKPRQEFNSSKCIMLHRMTKSLTWPFFSSLPFSFLSTSPLLVAWPLPSAIQLRVVHSILLLCSLTPQIQSPTSLHFLHFESCSSSRATLYFMLSDSSLPYVAESCCARPHTGYYTFAPLALIKVPMLHRCHVFTFVTTVAMMSVWFTLPSFGQACSGINILARSLSSTLESGSLDLACSCDEQIENLFT